MKKNSYNLCKDGITSKISINLKYDDSYNVKPKVKGKGTIEVNKINFLSPDFSEKLIKKKIELKILNILKRVENSDEDDGTIDIKFNEKTVTANDTGEFLIENTKVYSLPSSGGSGTYGFTISGVAILTAALLLFIKNKRKEDEACRSTHWLKGSLKRRLETVGRRNKKENVRRTI